MVAAPALVEDYYESGNAPHEALGRAARRLMNGGALYLGGGVGIEKLQTAQGASSYSLANGSKTEKFAGPLSAVMRGFALAGNSTAGDTPGGAQKVGDPAAAARLRELIDEERTTLRDIERYTARLAAKTSGPLGIPTPGAISDDQWEARRLAELRRELVQLRAERATLLATGKVEEAAEVGKPGTNWKQVTPKNRKTVAPLVRHYMSKAHPFTECVRDNTKRFGPERAKRICAVVKDMGERTTKWRKGGKMREVEEYVAEEVVRAEARLVSMDETLGYGSSLTLAEAGPLAAAPLKALLGEQAFRDYALLMLVEHPLGKLAEEFVFGAEVAGRVPFDVAVEAFQTRLHPHAPHGPHGGQFIPTHRGTVAATQTRRSSPVPEGSGVRTPTGTMRVGKPSRPTAPGAGAERDVRGKASTKRKLSEDELPKAVGKGRWSKAVPQTVADLKSGKVADTEQAHRHAGSGGKLGPYKSERIDLHAQIARALLQGAGAHPEDAQAVFLAGGPASGKSTLLKEGHVKVPADAVDVNPDIVKTMLPEYQALVASGDKAASSKVHEESSHIAKMVMNLSLMRHHHVIVDGVGNSGPGKFKARLEAARDAGHRTSVHYATIPTDDAVARAAARGAKTGRNVPEGYLRASHRDVSDRFEQEIQHVPGIGVHVYDTRTKRVKKTFERAIGAKAGQVRNQKLHDAFVRKAAEQAKGKG